ncbi:ABC transporter permease subunit [Candidatus Sumerlaeota bacterium]|nr:ABC transporter permease subunit [Candidatus Sumerlaeota bacterium]
MIRNPIKKKWAVSLGILSILILVGGYSLLSHFQHKANPDDTTIPGWRQLSEGVKKAFKPNDRTGEVWVLDDVKATFFRLFLGMFFGIAGAIVLGLLMGCFKIFESFLVPPLSLIAKIPPTAALAVFFVMVGTGTNMYVMMIAFGVLPILAQTVYLSVKDVPEELLHKAYTLGATQTEVIWNIIFRFILPRFIDAIRLQIGPAMVYLIAAEMVCGDVGFGYRIRLQSRLLNMSVVYPYLALLAFFGFAIDYSLRLLQKKACAWYAG